MSEFLCVVDISAGFRSPLCSEPVCIPQCNVCVYRDGPGKCKKYGVPSDDLRYGKHHNCSDAILDTNRFLYPAYEKLYPEACKTAAKK